MLATQVLKTEHEVIWGVIDATRKEAEEIKKTHIVKTESLEKITDFFTNFTDACHHAKEEEQLFPLLEVHGLKEDSPPINVLLEEHQYGRQLMRNISSHIEKATAGDTGAAAEIAADLLTYADMLRAHINKEDQVFFPMVDQMLSEDEQEKLVDAFEYIETEKMGEGAHEKFHKIAEELMNGKSL